MAATGWRRAPPSYWRAQSRPRRSCGTRVAPAPTLAALGAPQFNAAGQTFLQLSLRGDVRDVPHVHERLLRVAARPPPLPARRSQNTRGLRRSAAAAAARDRAAARIHLGSRRSPPRGRLPETSKAAPARAGSRGRRSPRARGTCRTRTCSVGISRTPALRSSSPRREPPIPAVCARAARRRSSNRSRSSRALHVPVSRTTPGRFLGLWYLTFGPSERLVGRQSAERRPPVSTREGPRGRRLFGFARALGARPRRARARRGFRETRNVYVSFATFVREVRRLGDGVANERAPHRFGLGVLVRLETRRMRHFVCRVIHRARHRFRQRQLVLVAVLEAREAHDGPSAARVRIRRRTAHERGARLDDDPRPERRSRREIVTSLHAEHALFALLPTVRVARRRDANRRADPPRGGERGFSARRARASSESSPETPPETSRLVSPFSPRKPPPPPPQGAPPRA